MENKTGSRKLRLRTVPVVLLTFAGWAGLTALPMSSEAATPVVVADWQMNEPAGTRVMTDSTGAHNGVVDPAGVTANGSYYSWAARCPVCLPVSPERVILVPDHPDLEIADPSIPFTLEFRYRTTHGYGNIMQKGESGTTGGQIKVQLPNGHPQCLFKGANGIRVGSGSPVKAIDDGQWHTVRCVHTATQVTTYVDGVRTGLKKGSTGPINNTWPFDIGGKPKCDQILTTCDYFSGDIDWVRVIRG